MYREIIAEMSKWKDKPNRKPLLITGARGAGKTWVAKDFGTGFFNSTIALDFKKHDYAKYLFEGLIDKDRVVRMLNIIAGGKFNTGDTFILIENIHLLESPYTLLKFLKENLADYYICCITYYREEYLFGRNDWKECCEHLSIHPLSFGEFLIVNKESDLNSKIENHKNAPLNANELQAVLEYLKMFYYIGGMPLVVKNWLEEHNFFAAADIQGLILKEYVKEFNGITSKALRKKVFEIWNSIACQLKEENKKFQYGRVKLTARAREYEEALEWLYNRRYIQKLYKVKNAKSPLSEQKDEKSFEAFMVDVGLLSASCQLKYNEAGEGAVGLLVFNNALTEQFAFQELLHNKNIEEFYYWTSEATARIEFVFEDCGQIIPIGLNIDGNKKAQSLKVFNEKYHNSMSVRITYEKFYMNKGILDIPIYSIWNL